MSVFKIRVTDHGAAPLQRIDEAEVRRAFALLADPEAGSQIFVIPSKRKENCKGSDLDGLVAAVRRHGDQAHLYFVLNPLPVDFTDYANNDAILRRIWLFIDIDPIKPANHKNDPASDAEHELTRQAAETVRDHLTGLNWPAPVLVDSGNGWYLLYRIELENNEASTQLVRAFLKTIKSLIADKGIVDTAVSDARRIARIPGTMNCKGQQSDDRPWRPCRLVFVPKEIEVVSADLIASATIAAEPTSTPKPSVNGHTKKSSFVLKAGGGDANHYVKRAMELEAAAVAMEREERNNRLNKAAYSLAGFIPTGYLSRGEIEARMFRAAQDCGLDKDDGGENGVLRTIQSGIEAGMKKPRIILSDTPYRTIEPEEASGVPAAWELCLDEESIAEGDAESILEPVDGLDEEGSRTIFQIYTVPMLMQTQFPAPTWVVQGLLSEGLNILAGKPKMGKSILALNLALTISGGGLALGNTPVEQGDVIYLALEDKFRRVQARTRKMTLAAGQIVSKHLSVATEWPRCDAGGLKLLDKWLGRMGQPRLIIIDVWPMFKPSPKQGSKKNAYDEDYAAFGNLKKFCDRRGINCLVLLHCRKGISEDVLDEVSGTLGQVGASDGIIVLNRSRTNGEAKIFVCGRDVDEQELSLSFDLPTLTWKSLGSASQHIQGKLQIAVTEYLKTHPPSFVKDIASAVNASPEAVRTVLSRLLEKYIVRRVGNCWSWPGDQPTEEGVI